MIATTTENDRWLIYAMGGGAGHLTRAVSLARAAVNAGALAEVEIITNSHYEHMLTRTLAENIRATVIDPRVPRNRVAESVKGIIQRGNYETLVVDTFPRGLAGELPAILDPLHCRKVLVHRTLCSEYVERFPVTEAVNLYDLILVPGEAGPFADHPRAVRTKPWLIRDANEINDPQQARTVIGAPADRPALLVAASGKKQEIIDLEAFAVKLARKLGSDASVYFSSPGTRRSQPGRGVFYLNHAPLIEVMPGVDLLLAAGGYNTVHEARATETPLLAIGQKRLYDRQAERLRPDERASSLHEMLDTAVARVAKWTAPRVNLPGYVNGVHEAIQAI